MNDTERDVNPDSGRWVRTIVVSMTLLIPVIAVIFAIRGEQPTSGETAPAVTTAAPATTAATTDAADADPSADETTTTTAASTTTDDAAIEPADDDSDTADSTADTTATTAATTEPEAAPLDVDAVTVRAAVLGEDPGDSAGHELASGAELALTGEVATADGRTWFGVDDGDREGWLPASDLSFATTTFDDRSCADLPDEPAAAPLAYRPGTTDGDPNGVMAIETHTAARCHRTVLILGSLDGGELAEAFPSDLSLIDFGGLLRLDLDEPAHASELEFQMLDDGAVVVDATRTAGSSLFIDRGPSVVNVSFLANPARIVVDTQPVSEVRPGVGGGVVISSMTLQDVATAGDGSAVVVTGWARLPAALGQIAFRNAPDDGDEPGSGLAEDIIFAGTSGVGQVERSWYFYRTATGESEWSEYRFEISGLDPGVYEMFLGLGDAEIPDGVDEPGIYQILDVREP